MEMNRMKSNEKVLGMVQLAFFSAIIIIMALVPFLGYIPLGVTRATIIHIPVIIGAIVLGPKRGGVSGGALWPHQSADQYLQSHSDLFCIHPVLFGWRYARQRLESGHLFPAPYSGGNRPLLCI